MWIPLLCRNASWQPNDGPALALSSPLKKWYPRDFDPLGARARGAFSAHEDFFNGLLAAFLEDGSEALELTSTLKGPEDVFVSYRTKEGIEVKFGAGDAWLWKAVFVSSQTSGWLLRSLTSLCPVCFGAGINEDEVCALCCGIGWGPT